MDHARHASIDNTELVLNMGPQHPSTHGVLRVVLKLDGENVKGTDSVIGYLHRGIEKLAESRTYPGFAPYVDRLDDIAAGSNGLGYCLTVEKLIGVEAPPRAAAVRVILTELNRIASHLLWLGTHAMDTGAITPLFYTTAQTRRDSKRLREILRSPPDNTRLPDPRSASRYLRRISGGRAPILRLFHTEGRRSNAVLGWLAPSIPERQLAASH